MNAFQMLMNALKFCAVKMKFKDGREVIATRFGMTPEPNETEDSQIYISILDPNDSYHTCDTMTFKFSDVISHNIIYRDGNKFYFDNMACVD